MRRVMLRLLAGIGILIALAAIGFVAWGSTPQAPTEVALQALISDSTMRVETEPWITFTPPQSQPRAGLIVYPGGHVDPRAYAPLARQIASYGYLVVVARMPLALAVLSPDKALDVMAAHPSVTAWAVGGHSLGGAMAARFAYTYPETVEGLVLWAAYPASTDDLSKSGLIVSSIYGTRDGLSTGDKVDASRPLLPGDTQWVPIEGGNHAQFGDYGFQSGDGSATIPATAQQALAAEATVRVLEAVAETIP